MKCDYLFVYGTLMSSSDHQVAIRLRDQATLLGEAKVGGRLYDIGDYPGFIKTDNPDEIVFGQLMILHSDDIIYELDEYEGVPTLYTRILVKCNIYDYQVDAAIYHYQGDLNQADLIKNGRYMG
jgi:gamma-glutamylcyclotransferase (GGCT)/AIG2-like uncharacterized protein YtfP